MKNRFFKRFLTLLVSAGLVFADVAPAMAAETTEPTEAVEAVADNAGIEDETEAATETSTEAATEATETAEEVANEPVAEEAEPAAAADDAEETAAPAAEEEAPVLGAAPTEEEEDPLLEKAVQKWVAIENHTTLPETVITTSAISIDSGREDEGNPKFGGTYWNTYGKTLTIDFGTAVTPGAIFALVEYDGAPYEDTGRYFENGKLEFDLGDKEQDVDIYLYDSDKYTGQYDVTPTFELAAPANGGGMLYTQKNNPVTFDEIGEFIELNYLKNWYQIYNLYGVRSVAYDGYTLTRLDLTVTVDDAAPVTVAVKTGSSVNVEDWLGNVDTYNELLSLGGVEKALELKDIFKKDVQNVKFTLTPTYEELGELQNDAYFIVRFDAAVNELLPRFNGKFSDNTTVVTGKAVISKGTKIADIRNGKAAVTWTLPENPVAAVTGNAFGGWYRWHDNKVVDGSEKDLLKLVNWNGLFYDVTPGSIEIKIDDAIDDEYDALDFYAEYYDPTNSLQNDAVFNVTFNLGKDGNAYGLDANGQRRLYKETYTAKVVIPKYKPLDEVTGTSIDLWDEDDLYLPQDLTYTDKKKVFILADWGEDYKVNTGVYGDDSESLKNVSEWQFDNVTGTSIRVDTSDEGALFDKTNDTCKHDIELADLLTEAQQKALYDEAKANNKLTEFTSVKLNLNPVLYEQKSWKFDEKTGFGVGALESDNYKYLSQIKSDGTVAGVTSGAIRLNYDGTKTIEPTIDGFEFKGFFYDKEFTKSVVSNGAIWYVNNPVENKSEDPVTIYTKWEAKTLPVEFYLNGATAAGITTGVSIKAEIGRDYTIPTPADLGWTAPDGKVFAGWADGIPKGRTADYKGGQIASFTDADREAQPDGPVKLYAIWAATGDKFKIYFNLVNTVNGDFADEVKAKLNKQTDTLYWTEYEFGKEFKDLPVITPGKGYKSGSWVNSYTGEKVNKKLSAADTQVAGITLTAEYVGKTYTITYKSNKRYAFNGKIKGKTKKVKVQYGKEFITESRNLFTDSTGKWEVYGWSMRPDGAVPVTGPLGTAVRNASYNETRNITLYAQWQLAPSQVQLIVPYDTKVTMPESYDDIWGSVDRKWDIDNDEDGEPDDDGDKDGIVGVDANSAANTNYVNLRLKYFTDALEGKKIALPTKDEIVPDDKNLEFVGWYKAKYNKKSGVYEPTGKAVKTIKTGDNNIYIAKFKGTYNVSFYDTDGKLLKEQTFKYGDKAKALKPYKGTDKGKFLGWAAAPSNWDHVILLNKAKVNDRMLRNFEFEPSVGVKLYAVCVSKETKYPVRIWYTDEKDAWKYIDTQYKMSNGKIDKVSFNGKDYTTLAKLGKAVAALNTANGDGLTYKFSDYEVLNGRTSDYGDISRIYPYIGQIDRETRKHITKIKSKTYGAMCLQLNMYTAKKSIKVVLYKNAPSGVKISGKKKVTKKVTLMQDGAEGNYIGYVKGTNVFKSKDSRYYLGETDTKNIAKNQSYYIEDAYNYKADGTGTDVDIYGKYNNFVNETNGKLTSLKNQSRISLSEYELANLEKKNTLNLYAQWNMRDVNDFRVFIYRGEAGDRMTADGRVINADGWNKCGTWIHDDGEFVLPTVVTAPGYTFKQWEEMDASGNWKKIKTKYLKANGKERRYIRAVWTKDAAVLLK